MGNENVKKTSDALATPAPPGALSAEMLGMLAQDANAGLENVRPEDQVIPFVYILQKNSPRVDEVAGAYIPGAKTGQFFESGTQTVYDTVDVIPCAYRTLMVEWHPREIGGGFVAQHEPGYEKQFQPDDRGNYVTDQGTILVQTMYFSCLLLLPDGTPMPVVIGFTSSQLKKARTWVTKLLGKKMINPADGKKFTAPIYASIWHLTSVPEENSKGSWRGYKIEVLKAVESVELFQAARKARAMFMNTAVIKPGEDLSGEG
jgi:hypothetical protein